MVTLFVIILILSALLIWLAVAYEKRAKELTGANERSKLSQANIDNQAQKMLEKLSRKSETILSALTVADDSVRGEFTRELAKASVELIALYKAKLAVLNSQYARSLSQSVQTIEKEAVLQVSGFRQVLSQETVDLQKIVGKKVEEEYAAVEKELQNYKQEKLKKIDESIYEILLSVSKIAFGKALRLEQKEELIFDALEKAKKEGVFTNF